MLNHPSCSLFHKISIAHLSGGERQMEKLCMKLWGIYFRVCSPGIIFSLIYAFYTNTAWECTPSSEIFIYAYKNFCCLAYLGRQALFPNRGLNPFWRSRHISVFWIDILYTWKDSKGFSAYLFSPFHISYFRIVESKHIFWIGCHVCMKWWK